MTTTTNRPRPVEMLATGMLDPHLPEGDPRTAWERRKAEYKLVSPANRKKYTVIVIGTGLAGSGVAAALGELGYKVESFTFHDAPRVRTASPPRAASTPPVPGRWTVTR